MKVEINKFKEKLGDRDYFFLQRTCEGDLDRYRKRIKKIGFVGKSRVLDAGCGFGQWLLALSEENEEVIGVDNSIVRVGVCQEIIGENGVENARVEVSEIQKIDFEDNSFDGIFCYSTIYFTDYEKTLAEFYRLLKKGGYLYLTTNSWGSYIRDIIKNPYATPDYNTRKVGVKTVINNLFNKNEKEIRVMRKKTTRKVMEKIGYQNILIGEEGELDISGEKKKMPFFAPKCLFWDTAYEILARK